MPLLKPSLKLLLPAALAGILALASSLLAQGGVAQLPSKPDYGVLSFESNLGSFKMLEGEGKLEINYTGTILISQLDGTVTPGAGLRREYNNPEKGKQAWHGKGGLTVNGKFRAIQWFGTNMKAVWNGRGRVRLYGDFDKNLQTGWYTYANDPKTRQAWSTFGNEIGLPAFKPGGTGVPVPRKPGGGG